MLDIKKIRSLIAKSGRTNVELAKDMKMQPSNFSRLLSGQQKDPPHSRVLKLAEVLGVEPKEIWK